MIIYLHHFYKVVSKFQQSHQHTKETFPTEEIEIKLIKIKAIILFSMKLS